MSNKIQTRTHKKIDNSSTFYSVFPEEMSELKNPERWGDIDDYRASWEKSPRTDEYGRVNTDNSDYYDAGWDE